MLNLLPSGSVTMREPSGPVVVGSCGEPVVAVMLRVPTFHVSCVPNVAAKGECCCGTNTCGGISGGSAMNPLWFDSEFVDPYGMVMLATLVVVYWKIALVTPAVLLAMPSSVGTTSDTKRRLS